MFKFNFQVDNEVETNSLWTNTDEQDNKRSSNNDQIQRVAEEIIAGADIFLENLGLFKLNSTGQKIGEFQIYTVKSHKLVKTLNTDDITEADCNNSDLIPGVYEGGAKIWECTNDLLSHLVDNYPTNYFENKAVLDLGCGLGLLGIYALKSCAARVEFQDYNKDVLESSTIPNALINIDSCKLKNLSEYVKFYSGDWSDYNKLTANEKKFDIIITSETIYNPDNQQKLLDTFDLKLLSTGCVFLAAKVCYFGVGGSLRQFEELIINDGRFQSETVWTSESGVGVCREILKIKRKSKLNLT